MTETTASANTNIRPGIYKGMSNEAYHSGPGISKSGLWTIHTKTPAHYKYAVRKETNAFDFGEAAHLAILEPDAFETKVYRGPDDRRGNKWKDAQEFCELEGKLILTSGDYDKVLGIRDAVHADAWINSIITGGKPVIEASAYWEDAETGVLCRCRPDLYRADLKVILDVKSTVSAGADDFAKSVINYGYHTQEAFYTDGWRAVGQQVDAFVFLAWEKDFTSAKAVYELPPAIVDEGREIARLALSTYAASQSSQEWPAYPDGVQELAFPKWAYKHTPAPTVLDGEAAA